MKFKFLFLILILVASVSLVTFCGKDETPEDPPTDTTPTNPLTDINNTLGFGLMNKVKGIWNGPVTSTTPLGGYPEWIVDFRPISENQISSMNELDTLNDILMSFFVAKYNGEYRLCFRNGGSFGGQSRISYFLADSVSEGSTTSYYRFTEIIKGSNRAYTEVVFKQDSMIIKSFTNHYNTLTDPILHMTWKAKLQDQTSGDAAVALFNFPKKTLTKDFSTTFDGETEAVFYSIGGGDPYPNADQPHLGQTTINYTYLSSLVPDVNKKVLLIITTQPLISGFTIVQANIKFRSRYVILDADDQQFVFENMHPGTYYVYAIYDADGNNNISSGDWVSTTNTTFTLNSEGTQSATTQINFTVP
jgi:hypothetical protein